MKEDIAYINITQFSERTDKELLPMLQSLNEEGAKGIILDLRSNPGGLLDTVVTVASHFLREGIVVKVMSNVEFKFMAVVRGWPLGGESLAVYFSNLRNVSFAHGTPSGKVKTPCPTYPIPQRGQTVRGDPPRVHPARCVHLAHPFVPISCPNPSESLECALRTSRGGTDHPGSVR